MRSSSTEFPRGRRVEGAQHVEVQAATDVKISTQHVGGPRLTVDHPA
jgi:hypothetical protein